jgi:hypothetical protein
MPSQVYWVETPWIMSADYQGRLTVRDYEDVMNVCLETLEHQSVYFVVDLSMVITFPLTVAKIPSMIKLTQHPNTAAFAWIGANRIARALIPKVVFKPMGFFDRREDGMDYLRQLIVVERSQDNSSGKLPDLS